MCLAASDAACQPFADNDSLRFFLTVAPSLPVCRLVLASQSLLHGRRRRLRRRGFINLRQAVCSLNPFLLLWYVARPDDCAYLWLLQK